MDCNPELANARVHTPWLVHVVRMCLKRWSLDWLGSWVAGSLGDFWRRRTARKVEPAVCYWMLGPLFGVHRFRCFFLPLFPVLNTSHLRRRTRHEKADILLHWATGSVCWLGHSRNQEEGDTGQQPRWRVITWLVLICLETCGLILARLTGI